MMEVKVVQRGGLPTLYVRECPQHPAETQICSWKQANERTDEHNERMHPRGRRKQLRRMEILAELQPAMRELIRVEDRSAEAAWAGALPFEVPPLERERLKAEGLLT